MFKIGEETLWGMPCEKYYIDENREIWIEEYFGFDGSTLYVEDIISGKSIFTDDFFQLENETNKR